MKKKHKYSSCYHCQKQPSEQICTLEHLAMKSRKKKRNQDKNKTQLDNHLAFPEKKEEKFIVMCVDDFDK